MRDYSDKIYKDILKIKKYIRFVPGLEGRIHEDMVIKRWEEDKDRYKIKEKEIKDLIKEFNDG